MNCSNRIQNSNEVKKTGCDSQVFVLWREVLMAYAAPALMASIGGWITAENNLQIRALTTIGGASALVALLVGLWLRNRGGHKHWVIHAPYFIVVGMFALAAVSFGVSIVWLTCSLLSIFNLLDQLVWLIRVWTDFALSATIASSIVIWRWRQCNTTNSTTHNGGDRR
ncbi:hypothetical protein GOP56_04655 [Brevibacillus sp. 7WMA2]|nr:hypothetical protein GOP56_04655 [Brevibacillus sp. 7WMA2]